MIPTLRYANRRTHSASARCLLTTNGRTITVPGIQRINGAITNYCWFSTGPSTTDKKSAVVIYERNSEANIIPRSALALTYFSSIYWTWYALDFMPTVNSSPVESLHIQPWIGVAGCTIAYAASFVACAYSKQMVSKVVLQKDAPNPIHVYQHSLPFMTASRKPIEYTFGDASLDYNSDEVKKLMEKIETKGTHSIRGHLPLNTRDRRWPLGLYITDTDEIKHRDLFLDTLLFASLNPINNDGNEGKSANRSEHPSAKLPNKKPRRLPTRKGSRRR